MPDRTSLIIGAVITFIVLLAVGVGTGIIGGCESCAKPPIKPAIEGTIAPVQEC